MNKEMKRGFKNNTIKLIIGLCLLAISWNYIQNHPAEKSSVLSGFDVMFQRGHVLVNKIFGRDSEKLKLKYDYEKFYKELIRIAEDKKCTDTNLMKNINTNYEKIKKESLELFKTNLGDYARMAHEYESIIKGGCK